MNRITQFISRLKNLSRRQKIVLGVILLGLIISVFFVGGGDQEALSDENRIVREVTTKTIADLSSEDAPLLVLGEVRSSQEADIRTKSQGQVRRVNVRVGQFIGAGTVIAEIENDAQRAAVVQAEGSFEAAEASLLKAEGGTREEQLAILQTRANDAESNLEKTQETTLNALRDALEDVNEVVRGRMDLLLDDPDSDRPRVKIRFSIPQITQDLENERQDIRDMLAVWERDIDGLDTTSDLEAALARADANIAQVRAFINKAALGVNSLVATGSLPQSQIDIWKNAVTTSQATISALVTANTNQRAALKSAKASLAIAQEELDQGVVGERSEDIAALEAGVKQARGALLAARANLEDTIIRTPVSGEVNALSIRTGDFVSIGARVATVANNGALEVRAFITGDDLAEVTVGKTAFIDNAYEGVVTAVAAGLDPDTKRAEVNIGLSDRAVPLVHGDSVSVLIDRNGNTDVPDRLLVPIAALRIGTGESVVFTVEEGGALVAHPVVLGDILGDKIVIENGAEAAMEIVVDARGLREGDIVVVAE